MFGVEISCSGQKGLLFW